ncbi:MAG TPA: ATP-binding protein [Acidobacteriota bacterium]|nr:ATP-binding protein [Acidobacteriota bacterium]
MTEIDCRDAGNPANRRSPEDFRALSNTILRCELHGRQRADFLREATGILIDFSGCDVIEVQLHEGSTFFRCEARREVPEYFRFESESWQRRLARAGTFSWPGDRFCLSLFMREASPEASFLTPNGSFWTGGPDARFGESESALIDGEFPSLAIIPLDVGNDRIGLLLLKRGHPDFFTAKEIELYEGVAQTLAIALAHRRSNALLRERVKELTCLYGIARTAARQDLALPEILQGIVELLPPAWLYPDIASGRLTIDNQSYTSAGFQEGVQRQIAEITAQGAHRGCVEVTYAQEKPERDEGPFLQEERNLIDTVAREVALIIERRQAEEEKTKLQEQLLHADRLATIGQLSAGVAHELNEPLGNVLGFAQLALKSPDLPEQARRDLERIASASLYARDVIRKLMLFARQMPSSKTRVNLNRIVEEGLGFFETRCTKTGIQLLRRLSPDLPDISADPSQITQVLVNLVVNAIQAMPEGGELLVQTLPGPDQVGLIVKDTGTGMSREVLSRIFIPFFTTKDVNEGTGLGLSVAHGIVTAHGGSIHVASQVGRGSRFEVRLPVQAPEIEMTRDE